MDAIFAKIQELHRDNLEKAGEYLVQKIKQKISRPNVGGTNPSQPGQPPREVTGDLHDSVFSEVNADDLKVGAASDHALDLELGTAEMAARPFLVSTVDEEQTKVLKIMAGDS